MNNKTWGGRFKKPPDPRAVKFNSSLSFDHILYEYDIIGSKAHAKMLAKQGLITEHEAQVICDGLEVIKLELKNGLHSLDEACEDVHMLIEHLLIEKIGDIGKKLHTGRSRNDQVALDLRLYTRDIAQKVDGLLSALCSTLHSIASENAENIMPGYTHLQQAQPIKLGEYFNAYLSMFRRDIDRLKDWHKRMNFSPLGAGALAGSSLPLDRHSVAEELGFFGIVENTIDAVSDKDYIIELTKYSIYNHGALI